jgi:hypothetical protein
LSGKLGKDVALLLFSSEITGRVLVHQETPAEAIVLPGVEFADRTSRQSWVPRSIEEVTPQMRDRVIQRTQSITDELRRYFSIDRDAMPCLLFLTRDSDVPFVIRTRDAADLSSLEKLFDELHPIADALRVSGILEAPFHSAKLSQLEEERSLLHEQCRAERERISSEIELAKAVLHRNGMDGVLDGLTPDNALDVYEHLGLHRDPRRQPASSSLGAGKLSGAMQDDDLQRRLRRLRSGGKKLKSLRRASADVDTRIARALASAPKPDELRSKAQTIEAELERVCASFEKRCQWRRFVMPVKDFARFFVRVAPGAKGAVSLTESIDELAVRRSASAQ